MAEVLSLLIPTDSDEIPTQRRSRTGTVANTST